MTLKEMQDALLHALYTLGIIRARMNSDKLYRTALKYVRAGKDASPKDIATDDVACMESMSNIIREAFPELKFPMLLSTRAGYDYFVRSPSFERIDKPEPGCIIISVTGTGNGRVENGHIGTVGRYESPDGTLYVMSNNSFSGKFTADLTIGKWIRYYHALGGMEPHYFRVV